MRAELETIKQRYESKIASMRQAYDMAVKNE